MSNFEPTNEQLKTRSSETAEALLTMQPGETLMGKFKIVDLLGVGGMGSVYRVDHLYLGRQFALKCLNKQQANDVSWRRFQNEAKAASKLDHPNLIKVHEFDLMPDGRPFILMDLVQGKTLSDLTKDIGSLPVSRALDIMIQVAFAVQYAHDQGIVHRDLKPTNIMVIPPAAEGEKETIKLVDFGIAKLTGIDEFNQQTLTKTGEIFGSPLYMSPEQCTGTLVDHRSDIYSIGCVFYELLTGAPPFIGENALSTMMKHQGEKPLSLKEASLGTTFPQALEQILAKLLEKDPNKRYQNCNALVIDLIPLTQDGGNENLLARLNPLTAIPPRQGQTTQFLPRETNKSKFDTQKKTLVLAILVTAIAFFAAGYATCFFTLPKKETTQDTSDADDPLQGQPGGKKLSVAPGSFYERRGNDDFFHFPAELETLGILYFNPKGKAEAKLSVRIPPNSLVALEAAPYLLTHPDIFDGFRPQDISLLDFGNSDAAKTDSFKKLARFTGLRALNVAKTSITAGDMQYLQPLKSLLCLVIGYNLHLKSKDLLTLKILPNLRILDVSDMFDVSDILNEVAALPNLRQLVLGHCRLHDKDLKTIAKSKSIKILSLVSNTEITDEGLKYLKDMDQLQWLALSGTSITAKSLDTLLAIRDLNRVEMMATNCTKDEMQKIERELKRAKPNLKFDKKETAPQNTKLTMPEFPWVGPGLHTHLNEVKVNGEIEKKFDLNSPQL